MISNVIFNENFVVELSYLILVANFGNHLAEWFDVSSKLFDFVLKEKHLVLVYLSTLGSWYLY